MNSLEINPASFGMSNTFMKTIIILFSLLTIVTTSQADEFRVIGYGNAVINVTSWKNGIAVFDANEIAEKRANNNAIKKCNMVGQTIGSPKSESSDCSYDNVSATFYSCNKTVSVGCTASEDEIIQKMKAIEAQRISSYKIFQDQHGELSCFKLGSNQQPSGYSVAEYLCAAKYGRANSKDGYVRCYKIDGYGTAFGGALPNLVCQLSEIEDRTN